MAANNYVNIVNHSGGSLKVIVNAEGISIPQDGGESPGHRLPSGDGPVTFDVDGHKVTFEMTPGTNSWSTIVFTNLGVANLYPPHANQGTVPYNM